MDYKAYALDKATSWVVGYNLFERIKELVNSLMNDSTKSGSEKRQYVLDELRDWAGDFASFIINAAIEVAVVLAKRKLGIK